MVDSFLFIPPPPFFFAFICKPKVPFIFIRICFVITCTIYTAYNFNFTFPNQRMAKATSPNVCYFFLICVQSVSHFFCSLPPSLYSFCPLLSFTLVKVMCVSRCHWIVLIHRHYHCDDGAFCIELYGWIKRTSQEITHKHTRTPPLDPFSYPNPHFYWHKLTILHFIICLHFQHNHKWSVLNT